MREFLSELWFSIFYHTYYIRFEWEDSQESSKYWLVVNIPMWKTIVPVVKKKNKMLKVRGHSNILVADVKRLT